MEYYLGEGKEGSQGKKAREAVREDGEGKLGTVVQKNVHW